MIVVSNTSPITNLAAIGHLELLRTLFGHIVTPQAVLTELTAGGILWPGAEEVAQARWIGVQNVTNGTLVDALRLELDYGEAEAIALALQRKAGLVLLDEQTGREAAQYMGLQVMGVVGILVRAKKFGYVDQVRPLLDALRREAGFFLGDPVYYHALDLAGERIVQVAEHHIWLNPPGLGEKALQQRTLCAAYGWPDDLSDEEILARLLALNLE